MQKIGSLRSINPYNPFLGMWTTLVRQPRGADAPLHPEQNLTREQAIRLYTINNAFLTFEETKKGSLEPGKLADFVVLDRDILTCPVERGEGHAALRDSLVGRSRSVISAASRVLQPSCASSAKISSNIRSSASSESRSLLSAFLTSDCDNPSSRRSSTETSRSPLKSSTSARSR